jgi:hypothetical protein
MWVSKWKEARTGRLLPSRAGEIVWPEIPSDYDEFWMLSEEEEKKWQPTGEVNRKKAAAALVKKGPNKRSKRT